MSSSSSAGVRRREGRILRSDAVETPVSGASAVAEAARLLNIDLAQQGLSLLDPARLEEAVVEGRAAGFEAGYAAGREEARGEADRALAEVRAEHTTRLAAVLAASESAIAAALAAVDAVAERAAQATADAAFDVAEAVVGRELALSAQPGRDAVARALSLAPVASELLLRLNPVDAADLDVASLPAGQKIVIVPDPSVAAGDCLAATGSTLIDARIGAALERVRAVLQGAA